MSYKAQQKYVASLINSELREARGYKLSKQDCITIIDATVCEFPATDAQLIRKFYNVINDLFAIA